MKFTSDLEFKDLLNKKKQEIHQRTKDGIQETEQFARLRNLVIASRRKYAEHDDRHILIEKSNLQKLCKNADERIKVLFTSAEFLSNRMVCVDNNLNVLNCNNDPFPANNDEARRFLTKLSEEGMVVFHIAPDAWLHYFIDGNDYGDGVFYSNEARKSYEELKTIDCLEEVLDDYRIKLVQQDTYLKFFVPKSGIKSLHKLLDNGTTEEAFLKEYKHLLHNKPEELFREDMRNYIKQHMKVVVSREVMLDSLDRLDIELFDEAGRDLYFIEIKWVGESIHADGSRIGTQYTATPRIKPNAVSQVVEYIHQLHREKKNIKIGYLAVFDARKEDLPDTCTGVDVETVQEDMRDMFFRYKKLKDFRVKNTNPR